VGNSRAGTVVARRRQRLVLLSPERSHAADWPAPAAAAVPQGTAMPAGIADTPAARFLAAVRSLSLARLLAVAKSLPGEGTAVLFISSHLGTRMAVLSPSPAPGGARTRRYEPSVSPG
jgi:hypothetical protein